MMKIVMNTIREKAKLPLWRYYAFTFLISLHFIGSVLVPFFTEWGGLTLTQVQLLQSWFMAWVFLLEVPTGVVADHLGRKYSLTLGAIVLVLGTLLYGSVANFYVFLFAEVLFAAAIALVSGADQALLYDLLKASGKEKQAKKVFGIAHAIKLTGFFVGAIIGSTIAAKISLNATMLLEAIPFIIAAFIAWTIPEPKTHTGPSESKRYLAIAMDGIKFFVNHAKLRLVALDAILVASAGYFVIWLYQPMLQSLDIPVLYFGIIHGILVLSQVIVSANFDRLEKFFGSGKKFIIASAVITAIGFGILAIFPSIYTVILFVTISGGFGLTRLEFVTAYMNNFIPSDKRATVLSSISMFRRLALVFFNPFIGMISDMSLQLALLFMGVVALSSLFIPKKTSLKKFKA